MLNGQKEYRQEKDFLGEKISKQMYTTVSKHFVQQRTSQLQAIKSMRK